MQPSKQASKRALSFVCWQWQQRATTQEANFKHPCCRCCLHRCCFFRQTAFSCDHIAPSACAPANPAITLCDDDDDDDVAVAATAAHTSVHYCCRCCRCCYRCAQSVHSTYQQQQQKQQSHLRVWLHKCECECERQRLLLTERAVIDVCELPDQKKSILSLSFAHLTLETLDSQRQALLVHSRSRVGSS